MSDVSGDVVTTRYSTKLPTRSRPISDTPVGIPRRRRSARSWFMASEPVASVLADLFAALSDR
jgi:hypothetical protein